MSVTLSGAGPVPASEPYYSLGDHTWRITTGSPDAQAWFDRGLIWAYSFNHDEAAACFGQVVKHDPACAMGYWGAAFAHGPNYNKPWKAFDPKDLEVSVRRTHELALLARRHAESATPLERALVDAIQCRFPSAEPPESFDESTAAYAGAMRRVYQQFGSDHLDIVTLAADALMNTTPWKLFEARTGNPNLSSPVREVKAMLERGLTLPGAKRHPGLLHMYIHLMEMSRTPEVALKVADCLRDLVPDGGHMQHMPSHIDVLIGDYRRAIDANMKASLADDRYFAREPPRVFYSFYRLHNLHSLIYAAMLAGQARAALDATRRMEAAITEDLLRVESPPMADWIEFFLGVRVHVLVRFGMWDDLRRLGIPRNRDLYCVTTASRHYGRAIAFAVGGDLARADEERELFLAAAERVPSSRLDFPNKSRVTLQVAVAMLDGELEYRRGNYEEAFSSLRLAVERDDALIYAEPWSWMMPTRHPYAALLLERGHIEEAARLYAEDLGLGDELARAHQHPNNVWALSGYHECLVRLGRDGEARVIGKLLDIARAGADVEVRYSCFCRLGTGGGTSGCGDGCCK
ncbi:hypothetical protein VUR80DRAFT_1174 [Thermomyces stellatus]